MFGIFGSYAIPTVLGSLAIFSVSPLANVECTHGTEWKPGWVRQRPAPHNLQPNMAPNRRSFHSLPKRFLNSQLTPDLLNYNVRQKLEFSNRATNKSDGKKKKKFRKWPQWRNITCLKNPANWYSKHTQDIERGTERKKSLMIERE